MQNVGFLMTRLNYDFIEEYPELQVTSKEKFFCLFCFDCGLKKSKKYAKTAGTEAIRTQIQPSKPKREIT